MLGISPHETCFYDLLQVRVGGCLALLSLESIKCDAFSIRILGSELEGRSATFALTAHPCLEHYNSNGASEREGNTLRYRSNVLLVLGAIWCMAYAGGAYGAAISSIEDGPWDDDIPWSGGVVPTGADDVTITYENPIRVVLAGATCMSLVLEDELFISPSGGLTVAGGDVNAGVFDVGFVYNNGIFVTTVGDIEVDILHIGSATTSIGGSVTVGVGGDFGQLWVDGSGGSITIANELTFGSNGRLRARLLANGPAGFTKIVVGSNVVIGAGALLIVDFQNYTPVAGDSWDIIESATSISGSFNIIPFHLPPEHSLVVTGAKGVASTVTVTVVGPMPSTTYWGLGALGIAMALGGVFYMRRLRLMGAKI